jgi:hypothetical protein
MFPCFILLAGICFNSVEMSMTVKSESIGSTATIRTQTAEWRVYFDSHNTSIPDWSRMNSVCALRACLAYHKFCEIKDSTHSCYYRFSQPGERQNRLLVLQTTSGELLDQAEQQVRIVLAGTLYNESIVLADLRERSPKRNAPYCRGRTSESCWTID